MIYNPETMKRSVVNVASPSAYIFHSGKQRGLGTDGSNIFFSQPKFSARTGDRYHRVLNVNLTRDDADMHGHPFGDEDAHLKTFQTYIAKEARHGSGRGDPEFKDLKVDDTLRIVRDYHGKPKLGEDGKPILHKTEEVIALGMIAKAFDHDSVPNLKQILFDVATYPGSSKETEVHLVKDVKKYYQDKEDAAANDAASSANSAANVEELDDVGDDSAAEPEPEVVEMDGEEGEDAEEGEEGEDAEEGEEGAVEAAVEQEGEQGAVEAAVEQEAAPARDATLEDAAPEKEFPDHVNEFYFTPEEKNVKWFVCRRTLAGRLKAFGTMYKFKVDPTKVSPDGYPYAPGELEAAALEGRDAKPILPPVKPEGEAATDEALAKWEKECDEYWPDVVVNARVKDISNPSVWDSMMLMQPQKKCKAWLVDFIHEYGLAEFLPHLANLPKLRQDRVFPWPKVVEGMKDALRGGPKDPKIPDSSEFIVRCYKKLPVFKACVWERDANGDAVKHQGTKHRVLTLEHFEEVSGYKAKQPGVVMGGLNKVELPSTQRAEYSPPILGLCATIDYKLGKDTKTTRKAAEMEAAGEGGEGSSAAAPAAKKAKKEGKKGAVEAKAAANGKAKATDMSDAKFIAALAELTGEVSKEAMLEHIKTALVSIDSEAGDKVVASGIAIDSDVVQFAETGTFHLEFDPNHTVKMTGEDDSGNEFSYHVPTANMVELVVKKPIKKSRLGSGASTLRLTERQ